MLLIIMLVVCLGFLCLALIKDWEDLGVISGVIFFILVLICFIVPIVSYDSYVNLKADYEGVIAQYGQAVTML